MPRSNTVSCKIDNELLRRLNREAQLQGCTVSEVIYRFISHYTNYAKEKMDLMRQAIIVNQELAAERFELYKLSVSALDKMEHLLLHSLGDKNALEKVFKETVIEIYEGRDPDNPATKRIDAMLGQAWYDAQTRKAEGAGNPAEPRKP